MKQRFLHLLGGGLAILGVGFVIATLWSYRDAIAQVNVGYAQWLGFSLLAGLVLLLNFLLAVAWWRLLAWIGAPVGVRWAIRVYGVSQLAKYVPGNIVHFASRQALGVAAGLSNGTLIKSTFWELGLLCVAGGIYALSVGTISLVGMSSSVAIGVGLATFLALILLAHRWNRNLAWALSLQVLFLLGTGWVFWAVVSLLTQTPAHFYVVPAFVVAWLVGFLTPGAPAGVGVREATLLFLLHGEVSPEILLVAVVFARAVTTAGDGLYFLLAQGIDGKK